MPNREQYKDAQIWNLSSSIQLDLPQVADQIKHEKINSISPNAHVLFYFINTNVKSKMRISHLKSFC